MNELTISKTLAVTKVDFFRLLPSAMSGLSYQTEQDAVVAIQEKSRIVISLQVKKNREVGAISLPQLQIDLCFTDWRKSEIDGFMECFDRHFQRGGG